MEKYPSKLTKYLFLTNYIFLSINDVNDFYLHKMHFFHKILEIVNLTKSNPGKINNKNISSLKIILLILYSYIRHIDIKALIRYMPLYQKKVFLLNLKKEQLI